MSATRTNNLGPLTTEFKVPESCHVVIPECATCTLGWQAQTCGDNKANTLSAQDDSDCWPERENSSASTQGALHGAGFYSPGISCPAGYSTSCSAVASMDGGGFPFQFPLTQGETAIGCCPSGYQCRYMSGDKEGQGCYSVAKKTSFTTAQCGSGKSHKVEAFEIPATVTETVSGEATSTVIHEFTIYAPLYQLNFRQTDLPASARGENVSTAQTGALSTGVRAGIGAAVGGIALSILSVASFLLLRQKHKHNRDAGILKAKKEKETKAKAKKKEEEAKPVDLQPPANAGEMA